MLTSFFNKKLTIGSLILAALLMSACAKQEDSAARIAGSEDRTTAPVTNTSANTCADQKMAWGKIFDKNGSLSFESQVKGFVSATIDPKALGTISGNINAKTGIDFNASFKFDTAGQLVPAESSVIVKIFDSFVGQIYEGQAIVPYEFEFTSASSGHLDRATRLVVVKFEDAYGSMTFQGNISVDGSLVEGTVYYDNKVAVSGYSASKGTLGSFKGYACAMIK